MKKKLCAFFVLVLASCFVFTELSFSEEESAKTGWQRFLQRFKKSKEEAVVVEKKTSSAPVTVEEVPVPTKAPALLPAEVSLPADEDEEAGRPVSELTIEELRERIKKIVEEEEDVLEYIPELEAEFNADGYIAKLRYSINGIFRDIEDLGKETLLGLFNRVSNERLRVRHERLIDQPARISPPRVPTGPPKIQVPPSVPRVPSVPQTPSSVTTSPPRAPTSPGRR